MLQKLPPEQLPEIPVIDVGADWPVETLRLEFDRAHRLLDEAGGHIPQTFLRVADAISWKWLKRRDDPYLSEIERIAELIKRPSAYYLNISYEWGCTTNACPSPDGRSARLMRVLDWPDQGLGRHIIAARVEAGVGRFVTLTWPGYTGVLQGLAPGRFAAALNQAPMDSPTGLFPADWLVNRVRVWGSPHVTPAHLLRRVFEEANDFDEARRMLSETPIALPVIYTLTGPDPHQSCVIERKTDEANVTDGPVSAANDWCAVPWKGRARGCDSAGRRKLIAGEEPSFAAEFPWLRAPVLNDQTRLAMVADASSGELVAQGFEADGPATQVLHLKAA